MAPPIPPIPPVMILPSLVTFPLWVELTAASLCCAVRGCGLIHDCSLSGAVRSSHRSLAGGQTPPPSCLLFHSDEVPWSLLKYVFHHWLASIFGNGAEIKGCRTRWQHCYNAAVDCCTVPPSH